MKYKCYYDVEVLIFTYFKRKNRSNKRFLKKKYIEGGGLKTFDCFMWDTKLSLYKHKIKILTSNLLKIIKTMHSYPVI